MDTFIPLEEIALGSIIPNAQDNIIVSELPINEEISGGARFFCVIA